VKGVINKGIQEFIESEFGSATWNKVKQISGCTEPFFVASSDYPAAMTLALIQAASEVSGLSVETVCTGFGRFWVRHTGKETYRSYFAIAGSTARTFLLHMNQIHAHVTHHLTNAHPPEFEYEDLPDGRLLIHYESPHRLCAVLRGIILGIGENFNEPLEVRELSCANRGDNHCTVEITFL
jgi:predicted hydrocarbon binding protein